MKKKSGSRVFTIFYIFTLAKKARSYTNSLRLNLLNVFE